MLEDPSEVNEQPEPTPLEAPVVPDEQPKEGDGEGEGAENNEPADE